jgi:hypothetical protein
MTETPKTTLQRLREQFARRCVCFHDYGAHASIREAPACIRCECQEFRDDGTSFQNPSEKA